MLEAQILNKLKNAGLPPFTNWVNHATTNQVTYATAVNLTGSGMARVFKVAENANVRLRITVDGNVVFEGVVMDYSFNDAYMINFGDFAYKSSFKVEHFNESGGTGYVTRVYVMYS